MQFLHNQSLHALNSFGVPAFTDHYIRFHTVKEIEDFCTAVDLTKTHFCILGGGSNILFVGDFPGYILQAHLLGIEVLKETSHRAFVKAAAGVDWHQLVSFCVRKGYGGIENLSLIPGTVGAAPLQNIGAYGVELKDVVDSVETIELSSGKKKIFRPLECEFGYRTSLFKTKLRNQYLITGIVLVLHKEAKFCIEYADIQKKLEEMEVQQLSFKAVSNAIIAIRQQKLPDPSVLGNAGSFFQNPLIATEQYRLLKKEYPSLVAFPNKDEGFTKISAAWLIEAAGFKGLREANVGVYDLHALILVHYGGGTGKDIINLANRIRQKIEKEFKITLVPEVNIVGAVGGRNVT
jgi:UDP-N-acetylmuramate dehydrogenase